ncbi:thymidine phosphorylase-like [Patiria miniata]|uniref:Thymidine phosphorylase n=1 Tax=Patiria miniata TaxID=46514 RepID=A0A913ZBL2_PATMI|nr:thymidine phosphorylase-like [Patiria miniata]
MEEAKRQKMCAETPAYRMPDIIATKRDGGELSPAEIRWFTANLQSDDVDDSQIGALLMAMYLKGLSTSETLALTKAMRDSGEILDWPEHWQGTLVDKHSTGGIGDKISLPLAPALAACDMKVPMISGRGLGHTGGTLDKLEAIPGYTVLVAKERMTAILEEVGCCIVGQTSNLVPADKKLYATRDVTSTVGSVPLITASIVSKKAAENVNFLVLDVKVGKAAFMQTIAEGRQLAQSMVSVSKGLGVKTSAFLTDMNAPIGNTMGNALEVAEALQCLQGGGPDDLNELVCKLGGYLLYNSGKASTPEAGIAAINSTLQDGSACKKFQAMLLSQGVSVGVAEKLCTNAMGCVDDAWKVLKRAAYTTELSAERSGYVQDLDALALGKVTLELGAGRTVAGADIDHAVGLRLTVRVGSKVEKGQTWIYVYHNSTLSGDHVRRLQSAVTIGPDEVKSPPSRILEIIE